MALKIAKVFDILVDYLLGEGKHVSYDKNAVKRLEDIETPDNSTKSVLFSIYIYTILTLGTLKLVKLTLINITDTMTKEQLFWDWFKANEIKYFFLNQMNDDNEKEMIYFLIYTNIAISCFSK